MSLKNPLIEQGLWMRSLVCSGILAIMVITAEPSLRAQTVTDPGNGQATSQSQPSQEDALVPPLVAVSPITATQGYAADGKRHYTFSTSVITAYDSNWKLLWTNAEPFKGLPEGVTHTGDGDYSRGKLYAPIEHWESCTLNTKQTIAIFNAKNGKLLGYHDLSTYGHEVSSITVVRSTNSIYVTSFCDESKIYQYDLKTFQPKPPLVLSSPISEIQGISWSQKRKQFAVTSDAPDGKTGYIWIVSPAGKVSLLYTVPQKGELEGVDYTQGQIRYLRKKVWFLSPAFSSGKTASPSKDSSTQ